MISYIKGCLSEIEEDAIIVERGGFGLLIFVPATIRVKLPKIGEEIQLHTYFQVREDAMNLYGFLTKKELAMFKMLIGVNGVGPKGALGILSALEPDALQVAIVCADAKAISKAPGIGVKTAQRVILDLKDKISTLDIGVVGMVVNQTSEAIQGDLKEESKEAVEALVSLGYSLAQATKAVSQVAMANDMTVEDVLKAALSHLSFL